jgi:hypothetical protein
MNGICDIDNKRAFSPTYIVHGADNYNNFPNLP